MSEADIVKLPAAPMPTVSSTIAVPVAEDAEELIVTEISIDGLCGVY